MANKAPSLVLTPNVGTAPESGANTAILISFGADDDPPAGVQAAKSMAAIRITLRNLNVRIEILLLTIKKNRTTYWCWIFIPGLVMKHALQLTKKQFHCIEKTTSLLYDRE
jgi:hypothetical protein